MKLMALDKYTATKTKFNKQIKQFFKINSTFVTTMKIPFKLEPPFNQMFCLVPKGVRYKGFAVQPNLG